TLLREAIAVLNDRPAEGPAGGGAVKTVPAQEILATPSLLSGWVAEHASDPDATLAIIGVSDATQQDAVIELVGRLGLQETTADLVVVPDNDPALVALRLDRAVRTLAADESTVVAEPMAQPRVSVIIPCYNYGRYLADAVESTLASSLREVEIIIVDDGSTDDSREVARRLIDEHPEAAIQLIGQSNCGAPGQVRNVGIARARGEYILCLDADDKIHSDFLRACAAALDAAPEAGIAYADFRMFDRADTLQQPPPFWNSRVECDCNFVGSASMFRRRTWEDVGGYETDLAMVGYEDWDFWVGCVEQGWTGVKVPGALWYYRVHAGSIYSTHVRRDQELKARIVLKHASLYTEDQRRWATAILAGDPSAAQIGTRAGWMPVFAPAPPVAAVATPAVIAGARRTAVVAFADELVCDPALLARWAKTFDGHDEVTLVIHAPGWSLEEAHARLSPLVAQAGLDGDDAADLMALALPASAETEAQLAAGAQAILSQRPPRSPFQGLPVVGVDSIAALRHALAVAT
ncbi:MAG: glycosyltransferase family 2 protein, partial [Solirubrobacteraceae bacterium]